MRRYITGVVGVLAVGLAGGCSHKKAAEHASATPADLPRGELQPPPPVASRQDERAARNDEAGDGDKAIYFDFDSYLLRDDSHTALQNAAQAVKGSRASLRIEGNCDERGTTEYNLALGEQRAKAAKTYLERLGVPGSKIRTISYGSEHPKYGGHDEDAWAKNRRDDLVY